MIHALRRLALAPLAALLLLAAAPALAQDEPAGSAARRAEELQNRALDAFGKHDYALAERLLRQQLELDPRNFVIYYNLACARSLQDDGPGAIELLKQAVERGFTDLRMMREDPDLAAARAQPDFDTIVINWGRILEKHRDANVQVARRLFSGPEYQQFDDAELRLAWLSAADPVSTGQAGRDIARLAAWGYEKVFPDLADPALRDRDAWVVVILPTPRDFRRWAVATMGADAIQSTSQIGGLYSHDAKRLVAMDLGATLRHEFFHVLHWRSATRLGQDHPPWIQEGLCSLVEDYELRGESGLEPVPSWRTNIAKRLLRAGRLIPLKQLVRMDRERFIGTRPLATYGLSRTVFLYLWQTGKLGEWYAAYTANHAQDKTGEKAFEIVYGRPIDEVERDFRLWLRDLPEVAEQMRPGGVGLGADVEPGSGDGPVIVSLPRRSSARDAGLRVGDVITAIDGKPTRDLNELVRILGEHEEGDEVEVSYRRGRDHLAARVRLFRQ